KPAATAVSGSVKCASARINAVVIDEAEILRRVMFPRRTWYEWRRRGLIPVIRPPGTHRNWYHWPSVEAALMRMQTGGDPMPDFQPDPRDSERFRQLYDLASSGNEEAASDLFKEFGLTLTSAGRVSVNR